MNPDKITISEQGVEIFGFPVGLAPTIRDLELAVEGESVRDAGTSSEQRKLKICDAKGVSWLIDLKSNSVLWLDISLGPVRHRKVSEVDASGFFRGKIRVGQYTIQGPFSFETGEIVRKVAIQGLQVRLIPDEKRIRAITIAFQQTKKTSAS